MFARDLHEPYEAIDPRSNHELQSSLAGKNIVVAGAGRGVGRAGAEFLVRTSCKAILLLALEQNDLEDTRSACLEINAEVKVEIRRVDVTDHKSVDQSITSFAETYGGVHVLFMNAGRPPQWLSVAESDPSTWWQTVAVSLQGAFNCSAVVLPLMQQQKFGRIIFTASIGAHSNAGMSSYVVGKLGQVRLAEIIHVENYKKYNICAFSFNPGVVRTTFFTDFADKVHGRTPRDGSYAQLETKAEAKSSEIAYNILKDATWDSPYMAAGLVTVLAAGKLDFMSGRYLDAATNIQEYIDHKDEIIAEDWHTVRLRYDEQIFPTLTSDTVAITD